MRIHKKWLETLNTGVSFGQEPEQISKPMSEVPVDKNGGRLALFRRHQIEPVEVKRVG